MKSKHVIIGCGNAGFKAALTLREIDKRADITLITDEKYPPYCRCLLTYYLENRVDEQFLFEENNNLISKNNIVFLKDTKIAELEYSNGTLITEKGKRISFDKLLIATGGSPSTPTFDFEDGSNVFTLRKFDDAKIIKQSFKKGDTVVLEGGGLVSLKTLLALYEIGVKPVWIVKSDYILSFLVDAQCAELITKILIEKEIEIYTSEAVKNVSKRKNSVIVTTDRNREIHCKGVIVGKGVKSSVISGEKDFEFGEGYMVSSFLETNLKNVYAAGDCIVCNDLAHNEKWRIPLWPLAGTQGKIAGKNMIFGNKIKYLGDIPVNSFSVFDNFIITGGKKRIFSEERNNFYEKIERRGNVFKKFIFDSNGKLKGYFLMNDIRNAGKYYYEILALK